MEPHSSTYSALLVEKPEGGPTYSHMAQLGRQELPPGDVTVRVAWSSVNYKDALSISGHPGVTRVFPHVPGVDAAGTVVEQHFAHVFGGRFGDRHRLRLRSSALGWLCRTHAGAGRLGRSFAGRARPCAKP